MERIDRGGASRAAAFTRRALFAGGVASLALTLTGCVHLGLGERSDAEAVQRALQAEVEALPEYADGTVKYVDGVSSGTTISGVLRVRSSSREQTEQALNRIHEALVRTYIEQPYVRRSFVRMTVSPSDDAQATVESADVAPTEYGATPTTDDIIAQFGLE
ncbi:MAG: hypothetical protein ACTH2J_01660 [Candidatus Microbacterium stercoravium]